MIEFTPLSFENIVKQNYSQIYTIAIQSVKQCIFCSEQVDVQYIGTAVCRAVTVYKASHHAWNFINFGVGIRV